MSKNLLSNANFYRPRQGQFDSRWYTPLNPDHQPFYDTPYYNNGQCEWWNAAPQFNMTLDNTNPVFVVLTAALVPSRSVVYYRNGTWISTNSNASTTGMTWLNPRIGSINAGADGYYTGDVAESMLYSRVLTSNELASLRRYVRGKYALW